MTVNVSGPLFDEGGNLLANVTCSIVAVDQLIGQNGGGRVERGIVAVTDGSGILDVDLEPGQYILYVNPTANDSTSITVRRYANLTVLTGETSMTLQAALNSDVGTITPSILQQAEQAALEAVAAADSLSARFYDTRAEAEAADTGDAGHIYVGDLAYQYDASGTALTTGDGRTWSPAGDVTPQHFGAVGDGVSDDADYVEAALRYSAETGNRTYVPTGDYLLERQVVVSAVGAAETIRLTVFGEGDRSQFIVSNSTGGIKVSKDGVKFFVDIRDIRIVAKSGFGDCGVGLHLNALRSGAAYVYSTNLERITIDTQDEPVTNNGDGTYDPSVPSFFSTGFYTEKVNLLKISNCVYRGAKSAEGLNSPDKKYGDLSSNFLASYGFRLVDAYAPILEYCRASACQVGYDLFSLDFAIEDGSFFYCQAGNCKTGILVHKDANSPAGVEPALLISHPHINARDRCIEISSRTNFKVLDAYTIMANPNNSNGLSPIDILINDSAIGLVQGNIFGGHNGHPSRKGVVYLQIGFGSESHVIVTDNIFNGDFLIAVEDSNSGTDANMSVYDNDYGGSVRPFQLDGKITRTPYTTNERHVDFVPSFSEATSQVTLDPSGTNITEDLQGGSVRGYGRVKLTAPSAGAYDITLGICAASDNVTARPVRITFLDDSGSETTKFGSKVNEFDFSANLLNGTRFYFFTYEYLK